MRHLPGESRWRKEAAKRSVLKSGVDYTGWQKPGETNNPLLRRVLLSNLVQLGVAQPVGIGSICASFGLIKNQIN